MELSIKRTPVKAFVRQPSVAIAMADIDRSRNESFGVLLNNLLQNSSAHGLPNISRASSIPQRLMWFILFWGAVSAFVIISVDLVERLLANGVKVDYDMKFSRNLPFPAVTICNLNPLRKSAIEKSGNDDLREAFDKNWTPPPRPTRQYYTLHARTNPPREPSTTVRIRPTASDIGPIRDVSGDQGGERTNISGSRPLDSAQSVANEGTQTFDILNTDEENSEGESSWESGEYDDWDMDEAREELYTQPSQFWNMTTIFTQIYSSLNASEKQDMGHQLKDFLINCQWNNVRCSTQNFTKFSSSRYGNCFTFNHGQNDFEIAYTNYAGPFYGLTLQLNIEQDDYLEEYSETAGVRVLIHAQDVAPMPEDDGFDVNPGVLTSIGIRRTEITRLGDPYSNCVSKTGDIGQYSNVFTDMFNANYSQETCMKACYLTRVAERCDCYDGRYPKPNSTEDLDFCNTHNNTHYRCVKNIEEEVRTNSTSFRCDSPQPCEQVTYTTEFSTAYWPARNSQRYVNDWLTQRNRELHRMVMKQEDLNEDLVRKKIY
ncbi:amiloride-sensitive sodium channel subunit beta-like isoform X2 [Ptychodera flava]|uniref:amiloride-sensitive sodium channel subunit beta-like isoform X2 n=1 Tax=Ptychodera flava TaxID=63121 RepID=UPI00396A8A99